MILCIDAGNSRIKWGLHDRDVWQAQGACAHAALPELPGQLSAAPQHIIACNVAGTTVAAAIEALATVLGRPLHWFRGDTPITGLHNGYADPARLGADRWAALAGARALHQGAAVVVMAGTATTIDALDARGCFRGGLILPGLDLMRRALARNTAGLPEACGQHDEFPANTDDAITSGAIEATVGAIERMMHRCAAHDLSCLLSGGAAAALAPHLSLPLRCVDNLVLEGLAHVANNGDLL